VKANDPGDPSTNVVEDALVMVGGCTHSRLNVCVAGVPYPVAVITKLNSPVTVGVPLRSPPDVRVMPVGRLPLVTANVGAGVPVAVTLKLLADP
jgi:hypothetical protein